MAKLWVSALALLVSAGLWSAPANAQTSDVDDVSSVSRGGQEGGTSTALNNKGLAFESEGFSLTLKTRVQFRLTYQNEVANGNDGTNGRDFVNFSVRRAKTNLSGHIFEKEFQYNLLLNWVSGGNNIVEEAWFRWAIMQYINVTAGQTKLQYNWEEAVSSGSQQFVERGLVNEAFNQDYAKGITLDGWVGDDVPWLKYWFGFYNGVLKANNDFRNADWAINAEVFNDGVVDGDMMINLRLETHPMGEVKRSMNDMRSEDTRGDILFAFGLGMNWFISGFNNGDLRGDTAAGTPASGRSRTSQDTLSLTLDGHFRWMGLSVDMAYFYQKTEFHNRGRNKFDVSSRAGIGDITNMGFTFDVSYFIIAEMLNVGIRYNILFADDFWQGDRREFGVRPDTTELGLSVNYYIHGDNLKLTFDLLMVSQQLAFAPGAGTTMLGVYNTPPQRSTTSRANDAADYNDLWIVRLQLQWIF